MYEFTDLQLFFSSVQKSLKMGIGTQRVIYCYLLWNVVECFKGQFSHNSVSKQLCLLFSG